MTARKHKTSEQTVYLWRRTYGGMEATQVVELKHLNQKNARLKKLLAERDLTIEVMQEIAAENGERVGAPGPGPIRTEAGHVVHEGLRGVSVSPRHLPHWPIACCDRCPLVRKECSDVEQACSVARSVGFLA